MSGQTTLPANVFLMPSLIFIIFLLPPTQGFSHTQSALKCVQLALLTQWGDFIHEKMEFTVVSFLLGCDCCDGCYCPFIVFTGQDLRCTPWGLMAIRLPPSGWLESSRGQNRISALVSAAERKAFSNAGTNVKLSERDTIQVGPCIALFPATTVYQFGSNQGRQITP